MNAFSTPSKKINILGVDGSWRNFGYAWATFDLETGELEFQKLTLSKTAKSKDAKKIRVSSDTLATCKIQYDNFQKNTAGMTVVMAEVPHGSQSAAGAKSVGITVAILSTCPIPIIELTAKNIKDVTEMKNPSKKQMIDWAYSQYPDLNWATKTRNGEVTLTAENEHCADAIATVKAGVKDNQFKQLLSLWSATQPVIG